MFVVIDVINDVIVVIDDIVVAVFTHVAAPVEAQVGRLNC